MDRMKEIETRLAEIADELEKPESDYDALSSEADSLMEEKRGLLDVVETRDAKIAEVRKQITSGQAKVTPVEQPAQRKEERTYDASSKEYRSAWLKEAARKGGHNLGELTKEERAAFVAMTTNTGEVVPLETQNRIIDLVEKETAIYADLTIQGFDKIFEVPRFTAILKGDAAATAEGIANADDEENDFDLITLTGIEFKKHAKLTRKMSIQSIDAFETWLVSHIGKRILFALNAYVYTQLDDATIGIQASNRIEVEGQITDSNILSALAVVRGGALKAYANRTTIYTQIAEVKDTTGRPIYTDTATSDPRVVGVMRGVPVKTDDSLADGIIYIGDPDRIEANMFDGISVASDVDVTNRVTTYGGYALFDCILAYPDGFAKVTITPEG